MRAAVIDIGSSSIKLIIGEQDGKNIRVLESLKSVIPIGKNTFLRGRIAQETINQSISLLDKYKQMLREYDISDVMVIATTAVREARNRDIFLDTIYRKTGFRIDILNVGDVVYYIDAFISHKLKKTYPIHERTIVIAELGAGSLDVSLMQKGCVLTNIGLPLGTLRLKQFISKLDGSLEENHCALKEYIANEILFMKKTFPQIKLDDVILIDDTYSAYLQDIIRVKRPAEDFFPLRKKEAEELLASVIDRNAEGVAIDYKLPSEIADTISGYAIVLNNLFKLSKSKQIYILRTSLPEALLAHKLLAFELSPENNKTEQLISVARYLCRKFKADLNHIGYVADLSATLFDQLKDTLGLASEDKIYLILAAYLHDVGMFINNRAHHKHSEYVISSLTLFRLTEEEINVIACVARYHRKGVPSASHPLYNSLSSDKQILIQKLSALLRIANALDRSHQQKVKKLSVEFNRRHDVNLIAETRSSLIMERAFFQEKKALFEEVTGNRVTLTEKSIVQVKQGGEGG